MSERDQWIIKQMMILLGDGFNQAAIDAMPKGVSLDSFLDDWKLETVFKHEGNNTYKAVIRWRRKPVSED